MIEGYPEMDEELKNEFKGKTILVTGGTGSIGSKIVKALKRTDVHAVRVLSNDENGVFNLSNELGAEKLRYFVGDVRDKERMERACENVDIVFHAAALKHVPLCEYNPYEAVKTNVIGTQNVIDACLKQKVKKMIYISTDKAVEPVNTMGASKLLAEKLVIDANYIKGMKPTIFSTVRFGNVIASRGSVFPLFIEQAKNGGPITLTSSDMTRFMMFLDDAIHLIFKATQHAKGGDIFTFKMPVANMGDIAEVIREEVAKSIGKSPEEINIENIGLRPGERLHEALMSEEEMSRAKEMGDLIIIPPMKPSIPGRAMISNYNGIENAKISFKSNEVQLISKDDIKDILNKLELL